TEELYSLLPSEQPSETMYESDLGAMLDTVYHFLCEEEAIHPESPDIVTVLQKAAERFDGGYVCGGLIGNGDSFVLRDKNGIRPAYYYYDDEIIVVASERPAIITAFNVPQTSVAELPP